MSRRRRVHKKVEKLDSHYASPVVAQLINTIMQKGKKLFSRSASSTVRSRKAARTRTRLTRWRCCTRRSTNVKPRLEVKSRRVGGATYQVPIEVSPERQTSLAMRWIVGYANARRGIGLTEALANEIRDAASGQGNAMKKRDDTHRMAQANRAFAHFRY